MQDQNIIQNDTKNDDSFKNKIDFFVKFLNFIL
jgi:hypothetical protein